MAASALLVSSAVRAGALRIVLANGRKHNPLSSAVIGELESALEVARSDAHVRAVVISAERTGSTTFSAGHDLRELASLSQRGQYELFERCGLLMASLRRLPVPVLAVVRGLAAAAGCQLVAACDMALAGPAARFSLPGASVGLFCSAPSVPVVRTVAAKTASYLLYTGRSIGAHEALRAGLVSHVVDDDSDGGSLDALVEELVADVASKPPDVVALGKRFLNPEESIEAELASYRRAAAVMAANLQLGNGREGLDAFIGKRQAVWK